MTDRDIMQQALDSYDKHEPLAVVMETLRERLAHCDRCGKRLGGEGDIHTCTPPAAPMTEFEEAVAACDNTLHHAIDHWQDRALKAEAKLAQPEQEPVAEVLLKKTGGNVGIATVIHEIYSHYREPLRPGDKLYTTPPAARQPLTDEEIKAVIQSIDPDEKYLPKALRQFARAIEAKLKEKNT